MFSYIVDGEGGEKNFSSSEKGESFPPLRIKGKLLRGNY